MRKTILEGLRSAFLTRCSLDSMPEAIWKSMSSLNTYGTNAIEGNTLTLDEVESVLLGSTGVERPISDIMETVQHDMAFRDLLGRRGRSMDLVTVQELHEEVFHGLRSDAGQWRRVNVMVRGANFTPSRPEKIVQRMDALISEYDRRDMSGEDIFTLGAWMHHGLESIHPFSDGNGRAGRLLLNLHLIKHNWPPVHVLPENCESYLEALERGNGGDMVPLTEFMQIIMGTSLLDLLSKVGTEDDELRSLIDLQKRGPYSAKYLALRAKQGELPALRSKGEWRSSERALDTYIKEVGREGLKARRTGQSR